MKTVYILRGISGSGKSKLAKDLASVLLFHVPVCSTDDFFMVDGEYRFDPSKLADYHKQNFWKFEDYVSRERTAIIVDNTNTQKWEYEKYVHFAENAGYEIVYITLSPKDSQGKVKTLYVQECFERNKHGVPLAVIQAQAERFEV